MFAKVLVAQKALIDNLISKNVLVDSDVNDPNDFETRINKHDGFNVKNNNNVIMEILPTGESKFAGDIMANKIFLNKQGNREGILEVVNKGWKGVIRPCYEGVELSIMGGDGGKMEKTQLKTYITGGLMSLFVLGNISCSGIFKSNPRLNKWSKVEISVNKYYGGRTNIVSLGHSFVLGTNTNELFLSEDNGLNWNKIKDIDFSDFFVENIISAGDKLVVIGNNQFIYKSIDYGQTWDKTAFEASNLFYFDGILYFIHDKNLYKTVNLDKKEFVSSLDFLDDRLIYITASNNIIMVRATSTSYPYINEIIISKDKGYSWFSIYNDSYLFTAGLWRDHIIVCSHHNHITKYSLDGGVSWNISNSNEVFYNFCKLPSEEWIAFTDNNIYLSDNDGKDFQLINTGYDYELMDLATNGVANILTTSVIGTTSGKSKAVLLVNIEPLL